MDKHMNITQQELLQHYLKDLTETDPTHGHKIKYRYPEHFNLPIYPDRIIIDESGKLDGGDIWVWSDLHLNHKNIIKYSNRPYPNVDLMNKCLIGNYINTVNEQDTVLFVGDITFGNVKEVNNMLTQLPGRKIHIIGNHDMDNSTGKLINLAFDEQYPCLAIDVVDAELEYQIMLTHYPLTYVPGENNFNIHGHIHTHPAPTRRHFNVSVEQVNYTPYPLSRVLGEINNRIQAFL